MRMNKPTLQVSKGKGLQVSTTSTRRITGRALQARRLDMWKASPTCACCGRVVEYPKGFELDHIVPLFMGGEDAPSNCQILCVWWDSGVKRGCHEDKTKEDGNLMARFDL